MSNSSQSAKRRSLPERKPQRSVGDQPGYKTGEYFADLLGVSHEALLKGISRGKHPPPTLIRGGVPAWDNFIIIAWLLLRG